MSASDFFANFKCVETMFPTFSDDFDIVSYIEHAQRDVQWMQNILAGSYIHDNGFYKITLFDDTVRKLRLHIWTNSKRDYLENIHNHRWDLHSRILIGSYKNELYERNVLGDGYYEYSYHPHEASRSYELLHIGNCHLNLVNRDEKHQGDYVFMSHEDLHRVSPSTDYTASLFLSGRSKKINTAVFSKNKYGFENISYTYMRLHELEFLFADFLTRITNG